MFPFSLHHLCMHSLCANWNRDKKKKRVMNRRWKSKLKVLTRKGRRTWGFVILLAYLDSSRASTRSFQAFTAFKFCFMANSTVWYCTTSSQIIHKQCNISHFCVIFPLFPFFFPSSFLVFSFKKKINSLWFPLCFSNFLFFSPVFLDSLDFKEGIGLQIPKLPLLKLNKKLN